MSVHRGQDEDEDGDENAMAHGRSDEGYHRH